MKNTTITKRFTTINNAVLTSLKNIQCVTSVSCKNYKQS